MEDCDYVDDKRHGKCLYYDEIGNLSIDCNYINGLRYGKCLQYDYSGKFQNIIYYYAEKVVTRKKWNLLQKETNEYRLCIFLRE